MCRLVPELPDEVVQAHADAPEVIDESNQAGVCLEDTSLQRGRLHFVAEGIAHLVGRHVVGLEGEVVHLPHLSLGGIGVVGMREVEKGLTVVAQVVVESALRERLPEVGARLVLLAARVGTITDIHVHFNTPESVWGRWMKI